MGAYDSSHYRVTLEGLKDQMYSLNMLWRLSLQTNDETTRAALERQIRDLEKQISDMTSGCRGL